MSIFDSLEKLITEHGSAAILAQQLSFAKDQFTDLERKVGDLQTQVGRLEAQLERERTDHKQVREDLKRLQEEHAEDIRIHSGIEFRRGKRTGMVWIAFCPVCRTPVDLTRGLVQCASPKCKWQILFPPNRLETVIATLNT